MAPARPIVLAVQATLGDACEHRLREAGLPVVRAALDDDLKTIDAGLLILELADDAITRSRFGGEAPTLVIAESGHEDRLLRALSLGATSHLVADPGGGFLQLLPAIALRLLEAESQQRRANEQADFLATRDHLTKLANRRLFLQSLDRALARAERHERRLAVLLLDIDHFKLVNDTIGYEGGDQMLRAAAARMSKSIRAADLLCRTSGDEFAVLIEDMRTPEDAQTVAEKLIEDMQLPLLVDGAEVPVTLSVGVATYPDSATQLSGLLRCADTALYTAKQGGRNRSCLYAPELKHRISRALTMDRDIQLAAQRDEFTVHYQPQVDVDTGVVVAFEALLRWNHPRRGLLDARDFARPLEQSGLMKEIGLWVLERALVQLRAWEDTFGLFGLRMAVNISAAQLAEAGVEEKIQKILEETGAEPSSVELEVNESVFLENQVACLESLERLAALGLRLSVDDFGVGYSSLRYLESLPIETLKIAGPFVRDLSRGDNSSALVRAIIGLARGLDLTVVAEEVENEQQLASLQMHQCDAAQGFVISKALSAEEAADFLRQREETDTPLVVS
ncbi:MAG: EAL domain-containing protein [Acidobacteriota bacterium]